MLISGALVPNRSGSANILPVVVNPNTQRVSLWERISERQRLGRLASYQIHSVVITLLEQRVTGSTAQFAKQ